MTIRIASTDIQQGRRWLSVKEATKYVSLSSATIMKYVKTGEIYGTRKGGKWLIDQRSLDTWLEEEKIKLLNFAARRRLVR